MRMVLVPYLLELYPETWEKKMNLSIVEEYIFYTPMDGEKISTRVVWILYSQFHHDVKKNEKTPSR